MFLVFWLSHERKTVFVQPSVFFCVSLVNKSHQKLNTENTETERTREKPIDELRLVIYHLSNTGKEVIQKYMSSNHSEVAET
jgi:hypothetical protein